MNCLLLNLARGDIFNIGLTYIASSLEAQGHAVTLCTLSSFDPPVLILALSRSRAQSILISVTNETIDLCEQVINYLHKHNTALPVIVGGIQATADPQGCIAFNGVSAVCVGEGEQAVCDLLRAIEEKKDYTGIANFWVKKDGRIYQNPVRPALENLDLLPFPNYRIFEGFLKHYFALPLMLTRGCLFDCPYCCNNLYHSLYHQRRMRYHSVPYSISLIKKFREQFNNLGEIFFLDDLFTWDRKWLTEFLVEFKKLKVSFQCNSRFDLMDEELIKLLASSGCVQVNMAVECGNERIRKEVLKRNITDSMILEKAALVKKYKVRLFIHNMIGIPYETRRDILKTVQLNRMIRPDSLQAMIFTPYKGTALRKLCDEKGWVDTSLKTISPFAYTVLKTPYIKPHLVDYYSLVFKDMVYERGWKLLLKKVIAWLLHFRHKQLYFRLQRQ